MMLAVNAKRRADGTWVAWTGDRRWEAPTEDALLEVLHAHCRDQGRTLRCTWKFTVPAPAGSKGSNGAPPS